MYNLKGKKLQQVRNSSIFSQLISVKWELNIFFPYCGCVTEWWLVHKDLPTVKEILDLFKENNPKEVEKSKRKKAVLTWYANSWLPCASGNEYYNDKINTTVMYTDETMIGNEAKVRVTISSEAFGLLQLENCSDKWPAMFEYKALHGDNKDSAIPRKGEEAEPFKAKYSDSKKGQIKYGGWSAEGLKRYNSMITSIVCFRARDRGRHNQMAIYMRKLCQEKQCKLPTAGTGKRQRAPGGDDPPESPPKITRIDE